jgi:hypothetical protein
MNADHILAALLFWLALSLPACLLVGSLASPGRHPEEECVDGVDRRPAARLGGRDVPREWGVSS